MRRHCFGPLLFVLSVAILGACTQPEPTPTATPTTAAPTATPTPTEKPTVTPASGFTKELDGLRQLAFAYWEAFNSYDVDKVLSYLEESYRIEREGKIRGDIGLLGMFRTKLGISEESPPQITGPGEAEMFLLMREPLGTRRIRMAFRRMDGEWKITYAQEVK